MKVRNTARRVKMRKLAQQIIQTLPQLQQQGAKITHEAAAGDWFGPSLDDFREGEDHVISKLTDLLMRNGCK
jgi:hypothetical protein